eukprot:153774_1
MDSLHFFIFHLFHVGLRSNRARVDTIKNNDEKMDKDDKQKYFDAQFSQLSKMISERSHLTKSFDRFNIKKTKFNLNNQMKTKTEGDKYNDDTYLDMMFKYLKDVGINFDNIIKLNQFVTNQEYDSESVTYDGQNGNIAKLMNNKQCIQSMQQFKDVVHMSVSSFNIGLRFYYWPYYKSIKRLPDYTKCRFGLANNYNDHSGFDIDELFVAPRYNTFKEEIFNYEQFDINQYAHYVVTKAKKYINTQIVKAIKAFERWGRPEHYDPAPFGLSHLCAIILYCDFSDLSTNFSSTFRKMEPFETLVSIKARNSRYYWLSKILRETVEIYGQCRFGKRIHQKKGRKKYANQLCGPYYCGMSSLIIMPGFNIRLCSPTSTSMHIEVAIKFSGREGIIIQLDNPFEPQYRSLRGFNCSWISRYKEEDERLFFGGWWCIRIDSIRVRSTNQNFEIYIKSLYCLDLLITGSNIKKSVSKDNFLIIKHLIDNYLCKETTAKFEHYVHATFQCFVESKKQIVLETHMKYGSYFVKIKKK